MSRFSGYREFAVPPAWRDALACLWIRVVPARGSSPTRVLPDGCVDLVWEHGRGARVAGPDTGPGVVAPAPGTVVVGARFQPGAGGPALRLPLSELRDMRVDAADLWPELDARLPPTLAPRAALRRVGAAAVQLAVASPPDGAIRAAARRLEDPRARVDRLAGDLGLSERQLRRRSHDAVGYGPKTLQRVLRLRRFLTRADADDGGLDLARAAADAGYSDQAHLTRECTRLAGLPPAALARERHAS
jgi:AraC-like DNA-binding protein